MNGQQRFCRALLDPAQPAPAGLGSWNGSDPTLRFAVYRNNVLVSLIDALADTYPVTQELVGEEFFRAMARLFVAAEPPRSPVLALYGESFPDYIEGFPPASSVPYLADVARLEMMRVRAYHAADEDGIAADAITLALADIDALPDLGVNFHPSMGLLRSPYAVVSLWAAHQGGSDISTVDPFAAESALVLRVDLDVAVISLGRGASDFVARLQRGESLGSSVGQASLGDAGFDLAGTLGVLIREQAITSIVSSRRVQQ